MEKTGQVEPPDLSGNQYVYWGTKNEANIADWFQEETGKKVRKLGTLQNRSFPFMLANIDREVVGENAGQEVKTGETLWDIAGGVASNHDDIRRIIWKIQRDNDIGGNEDIQPGQRLIIKF